MPTFFRHEDYGVYIDLMAEWCRKLRVEIWAYCLMPNHVHLLAVPESKDGLAKAVGEAHRRYTRHVNFREGWRGHLWQGRFKSYAMDESYLLSAVRYIELNPVRAKLVRAGRLSMEQRRGARGRSGGQAGRGLTGLGDGTRLARIPKQWD